LSVPDQLLALCYHQVSSKSISHIRHLYPYRTERHFEIELDWLLARFNPVDLEQVVAWKRAGAVLPKKAVFMSFDDGFREMAEVVAPLCKRKGIPVTFFLTTNFLDNQNLGYRHKASLLVEHLSEISEARRREMIARVILRHQLKQLTIDKHFPLSLDYNQTAILDDLATAIDLDFEDYLHAERPYLSHQQVQELLRGGFTIGAHSLDHPPFNFIPLREQIRQTSESIEFLQRKFGMKRRVFAFPFVSDGVANEFYQQVFDRNIAETIFCIGAMPQNHQWPLVRRVPVEGRSNDPLWQIVRGQQKRHWKMRILRLLTRFRRLS
jgi:peptidoglycan/xylan/chitin deacetylase (PgdA/CDA1 family)